MGIDIHEDRQDSKEVVDMRSSGMAHDIALLTGGSDRPYVFGLATSLASKGLVLDLIGSDELDLSQFHSNSGVNFLNFRGNQRLDVGFVKKALRVSLYYSRLLRYAATTKARIFHILWNNKFELFDRTILMLYYRFHGRKIVLTVHNVNTAKRDTRDTFLNRLSLKVQYRLADHIFVHTEKMKLELVQEFGIESVLVTVIPFGINNAVPNTPLTPGEAKQRLGIAERERTILFFGRIAPYKGLAYLINAFRDLEARRDDYRLIIAGRPDRCERYWGRIHEQIQDGVQRGRILVRAEFIPDDETEVYFKAADVLVLPYTDIYQSGVLFLSHSFGLPVVAADVGSLRDDIVDGKTGFLFAPEDPVDLARAIERYFASKLYADLNSRRREIREYATERHSWDVIGQTIMNVYAGLFCLHGNH